MLNFEIFLYTVYNGKMSKIVAFVGDEPSFLSSASDTMSSFTAPL